MPVRYEFEKEINQLHRDLIKLGAIIEEQIDNMISALVNQDAELASEVIERDDIIDDMELKIEQECILMIARQQPIASDLRDIASILKMITDLERIADHCEDICKYTINLSNETYFKPLESIPEMAYKVKGMTSMVIDSAIKKDLALADAVVKMDDEIDAMFHRIIKELKEVMTNDIKVVNQCVAFMFITKYLERMGDHATNIAGWIRYNVTGEHFE
jgi:phosphate transport system protein